LGDVSLVFFMKLIPGAFKLLLHINPKDDFGEGGYTINGLRC